MAHSLLAWVLGCLTVYAALFGTGSVLYGNSVQAAVWIVVFLVSGTWLASVVRGLWRGTSSPAAD
jgi:hypothetical protein